MTLEQAIENLDAIDDDAFLCAPRPWQPGTECIVTMPTEDLRVPAEVRARGFEYFIGVASAHQALQIFGATVPTLDEKVRLLLRNRTPR